MEYVFGTVQKDDVIYETVRTKQRPDEANSNDTVNVLSGKVEVERKFDDNIITDIFVIDNHYHSSEDSEGNIYDWYIIRDHNRYIDKFTPSIKKTECEITDIDIQMIELKLAIIEIQEKLGIEPLDFDDDTEDDDIPNDEEE